MGSSILRLTLNEVQTHLGEPLLSMNLDELLKNVLPAEATSITGQYAQGSVAVSRTLGKKTVEEVWLDIQRKKAGDGKNVEPTLREMTLEDFLVKAAVPAAGRDETGNPVSNVNYVRSLHRDAAHWVLQYQQQMMGAYVAARPVHASAGRILDGACWDGQASVPPPIVETLLNSKIPGRKRRVTEGVEEKTVERRQKRMIKNRESAARSRARKQAYTNELENKVSRLEEENERLKTEKKLNNILHCALPPEPKHRLRRTSSAAF